MLTSTFHLVKRREKLCFVVDQVKLFQEKNVMVLIFMFLTEELG